MDLSKYTYKLSINGSKLYYYEKKRIAKSKISKYIVESISEDPDIYLKYYKLNKSFNYNMKDIWPLIFSFIEYKYWKNVKQTCKLFNLIGIRVFDITICDNKALLYICKKNYIDVLKSIMKYKIIDLSFDNNKLMHKISETDNKEIAKFLIEDEKVKEKYNKSSIARFLYNACTYGFLNMVKLFLNRFNYDNKEINVAFGEACVNGKINIAKYFLLYETLDPSDNDNSLFYRIYHSVSENKFKIYKLVANHKNSNISLFDNRLLRAAIKNDDILLCKIIIESKNFKYDNKDLNPVYDAIDKKSEPIITLLLSYDIFNNKTSKFFNSLITYSEENNKKLEAFLYEQKTDYY